MADTNYNIPAVEKAIAVMQCLCEKEVAIGVTELSREVGLNKNMVFRLLYTLENQGWIVQEEGPKYRVSLQPFRHFSKPVSRMDVRQASRCPIEELWSATGESCYLAVLDNDRCLFVEHLDSTRAVRAHGRVGGRYQMHCCAPGKILLAYAEKSLVDQVIKAGLDCNTIASITKPSLLRKHLKLVRQQGYALDLEEYSRGMLCLAAPVFNSKNEVAGSLGISVLTLHYTTAELFTMLGPQVMKAARNASEILGASEDALAIFNIKLQSSVELDHGR